MKKTFCKRDVLIFNITLSHSEQKFPRKIASQKHEEKKKNAKISFHPSSHQQKKKKKNKYFTIQISDFYNFKNQYDEMNLNFYNFKNQSQ